MADPDNILPLPRGTRDQGLDRLPTAEQTGPAIMSLLQQAADVSRRNEDRAKAAAAQLAEELKERERHIRELESRLRHFQDRAEAAEQWMVRIGNEIQERLIEPRSAMPAERAMRR
jgi:hypothetical protein